MITPAEAELVIAQNVRPFPAEDCPISFAGGRVLRRSICADRDLPPFDRVTMDGYAVNSKGLLRPTPTLHVKGLQAAGMIPLTLADEGDAIEIATGAVLPEGADCIVPYECVERAGNLITIAQPETFRAGSHVHRRASDHRADDEIVPAGLVLTAREIAVAAACGEATLRVSIQPRIAVIATGDELAEVEAQSVAPHQIRRSNDHALRAALLAAGFSRVERFHFRDDRNEILHSLRRLLSEYDLILVTGGVSKGKFDHLPGVLTDLGVTRRVQGVAQRPGKPFWFGIGPRDTPVFALPGNPVSALVCFTRYVLPALHSMAGGKPKPKAFAALSTEVKFEPKLACFLPVRILFTGAGQCTAIPAATNTSGDFSGLIGTDGFVELPADLSLFPAGTVARYFPWA